MKANSEAAKRRLARLNDEYRVRQEARKLSRSCNHQPGNVRAGNSEKQVTREDDSGADR